MSYDVDKINQIPIKDIAQHLGIEIPNGNRNTHCFNSLGHSNGDRTPSLMFDDRKNTWFCFGCRISQQPGIDVKKFGEDVLGLIMAAKQCGFKDACKWASDTFGIGEVSRKSNKGESEGCSHIINRPVEYVQQLRINNEAEYEFQYSDVYNDFYYCCSDPNDELKEWWKNRGLSSSLLESVGLKVLDKAALERIKAKFNTDQKEDELFKSGILKKKGGKVGFAWDPKLYNVLFPFFNGGIKSLAKDKRSVIFFKVRSLAKVRNKYLSPKISNFGGRVPLFGCDELYEWLCAPSDNKELYITESETDRFAMKEYFQMAEEKPNTLRFVVTRCSATSGKLALSELAKVIASNPTGKFVIVMDKDNEDESGNSPSKTFVKDIYKTLLSVGVEKEQFAIFRPHHKYDLKDIGDYVQALKANTLPEQIDKTKGTI